MISWIYPINTGGPGLAKYNQRVLVAYSSYLYFIGYAIIVFWIVAGGLVGYGLAGNPGAFAGMLIGAGAGFVSAFMLFVLAQLVLCFVQIERNTNRAGDQNIMPTGAPQMMREVGTQQQPQDGLVQGTGEGEAVCRGCMDMDLEKNMLLDPKRDAFYHKECL